MIVDLTQFWAEHPEYMALDRNGHLVRRREPAFYGCSFIAPANNVNTRLQQDFITTGDSDFIATQVWSNALGQGGGAIVPAYVSFQNQGTGRLVNNAELEWSAIARTIMRTDIAAGQVFTWPWPIILRPRTVFSTFLRVNNAFANSFYFAFHGIKIFT